MNASHPVAAPAHAHHDWLRPLLAVTMLTILVCAGFYVTREVETRREDARAAAAAETRAKEDAVARMQDRIQAAIEHRIALIGMTRDEVLKSKGNPERKLLVDEVPDHHRSAGSAESWIYGPRNVVLFGVDGLVVNATDSLNIPEEYFVRR